MTDGVVLGLYNLPKTYKNITYKDTGLVKVKQEDIQDKISRAPLKGTLTITGIAAPVVNQLIDSGLKVRGINFLDRSSTAFEQHENPHANIVVLYNVGNEVSLNSKVSGMVLRNIIKHYESKNTLLIIETDLSKGDLLSRYDFRVTNYIRIPKVDEAVWI